MSEYRPRPNEFIFPADVLRVIDGDTIELMLNRGGGDYYKSMCRLVSRDEGVDTPERNTDAGKMVRDYVATRLDSAGHVQCQYQRFGKFAGRFLGCIFIDGLDLCDELIALGMGYQYNGGHRREWTADALDRVIDSCRKHLPDMPRVLMGRVHSADDFSDEQLQQFKQDMDQELREWASV